MLTPPALALFGNALRVFLTPHSSVEIEPAVHAAFTPGPYYPVGPAWQVLALSVAGGILALIAVTLGYLRPTATAEPAPVVQVDN